MKAICDSSGEWFLVAGMCIELNNEDIESGIYGLDENGWNGLTTGCIFSNGKISLDRDVALDDEDYLFKLAASDGDFDFEHLIPIRKVVMCNRPPRCQRRHVHVDLEPDDVDIELHNISAPNITHGISTSSSTASSIK